MMERVDKVNFYLNLAEECARRGTCIRRNYGAVIVKNDEVIATGYTGAARGMPNCCDRGTCKREDLGCKPGERYDLCLAGDTKIRLANGESKTIKELYDEEVVEELVYSINDNKQQIVTTAKCFRKTATDSELVEITFDNGEKVCCTPTHPFMLIDSTYCEAKDLVENDEIMGTVKIKGVEIVRGIRVFSVRQLRETADVYDCTVPTFNNFGIDIGGDTTIYVHNCVSVHAEMNAIISAARRDMVGATLYLTGIDAKTGKALDKSEPCLMCRRMIINAGIIAVVGRKGSDGDFVRTDVLSYQVLD